MKKIVLFSIIIFTLVLSLSIINAEFFRYSKTYLEDVAICIDDEGAKEVKLPNKIKANNKVTLQFYLDDRNLDSIYFDTDASSVIIYIDDELIYEYNGIEKEKTHNINIYKNDYKVEVVLEGSNEFYLSEFHIGNDMDILVELLFKDFLLLFVCLLLLFTSILSLFISIHYFVLKNKNVLLLGYSIFASAVALWSLVQIDFIRILFSSSSILLDIKNFIIYLLPVGATLVCLSFNKNAKMKLCYLVGLVVFSILLIINLITYLIDNQLLVMYDICYLLFLLYLIILFVLLFISTKQEKAPKNSIILKYLCVIFVGFFLEYFNYKLTFIPGEDSLYVLSSLIIIFSLELSYIVVKYVRNQNYNTYLSEENQRLSSSILLSQIKPHFLYNALNSISFLCKKDPKQADMAVLKFSRYLRQNMKCIESEELLDFSAEIEHIKNYLYLETIRFPKLEIIYELKYIDFKIPPLCIQPIVENSVKHGVSKNIDCGCVIIKSYLTAKHIVIEIRDNGIGFDTEINIKGTGLSNISRRLKLLIDANIEFGSELGKGTIVRVTIPRKDVK